MKNHFAFIRTIGVALTFALGLAACGGDDGNLVVTPAGPTVVQKGTTLQFSANKSNVTWSVEGGNGNGSIDGSGLYTPPAALPAGSPEITVTAASGNDTASGVVSLRTADQLTFGSSIPVSDGPATFLDSGNGFMTNRMAVGLGSVHEIAVYSALNGTSPNLFVTQALDLGDYLEPVNITDDASVVELSAAIEMDSELNPHILFSRNEFGPESRLFMVSSSDQGETFGDPVAIFPNDLDTNGQAFGFTAIDANDDLHVVFSSIDNNNNTGTVYYTRSGDGGATWLAPKAVTAGTDDLVFSSLAVSPDGNTSYVVYYTGDGLFVAKSSNGGANFGAGVPLITGAADALPPFNKVALDPQGNVYVVYSVDTDDNDTIEAVIQKSTDGGATFSSPARITSNTPDGTLEIFVNIDIDNLGRIDAVWSSGELNQNVNLPLANLVYARSLDGGATFGEPQTIVEGANPEFALVRALRHDESGRLYVQYLIGADLASEFVGEIFSFRAE